MLGHLGMISLTNHDSSEGEQWGRYNLPRYVYGLWIFKQSSVPYYLQFFL